MCLNILYRNTFCFVFKKIYSDVLCYSSFQKLLPCPQQNTLSRTLRPSIGQFRSILKYTRPTHFLNFLFLYFVSEGHFLFPYFKKNSILKVLVKIFLSDQMQNTSVLWWRGGLEPTNNLKYQHPACMYLYCPRGNSSQYNEKPVPLNHLFHSFLCSRQIVTHEPFFFFCTQLFVRPVRDQAN